MMLPPDVMFQDYMNETSNLLFGIQNHVLQKTGKIVNYNGMTDEQILGAVVKARKFIRVHSVQHRFFESATANGTPKWNEKEKKNIGEWMGRNPERVERANQLAHVLNSTIDVPEFKRTINEMNAVVYGDTARIIFEMPEPAAPSVKQDAKPTKSAKPG